MTGQASHYLVWNEIPTVLGNLVGGLLFTALPLYVTHARTQAPSNAAGNPGLPVEENPARTGAGIRHWRVWGFRGAIGRDGTPVPGSPGPMVFPRRPK